MKKKKRTNSNGRLDLHPRKLNLFLPVAVLWKTRPVSASHLTPALLSRPLSRSGSLTPGEGEKRRKGGGGGGELVFEESSFTSNLNLRLGGRKQGGGRGGGGGGEARAVAKKQIALKDKMMQLVGVEGWGLYFFVFQGEGRRRLQKNFEIMINSRQELRFKIIIEDTRSAHFNFS